MGERAPYSRVYWSIVDDPKFESIFGDDRHLATWLRLLIGADAIWPAAAMLPATARKASLTALVEAGLVDVLTGHRYRIHGLDAERSRRREAASKGPKGDQEDPKGEPNGFSRAGDAMLGSASSSSAELGEAQAADALDTWYRLTGSWPSPKVLPWLNRLVDDHGEAAVSDAIAAEWSIDSSRGTILGRVQDRLAREAHEAEKRHAAAQAKAAEDERRKIESMPEEQRAANLARLRDEMSKAGLLPAPPKPS